MKWYTVLAGLAAFGAGAAAWLYYHPHTVIGSIQKLLYKDKPINSFKPFGDAGRKVKENGQLYVTEIRYGADYPNSYLDISYPNEDTTADRPTVIYFHGGGFFSGDKAVGDPMAADDDANRLLNEIIEHGYNLVSVNYALVPDCHFPAPLIQMEQAIAYLKENAASLGLNMENVVLFGQSAGAVLTAQYGSLMANHAYRELLGLHPTLSSKEVQALIIDDAPLRTEKFGLALKLMLGDYFGSMKMKGKTAMQFNAFRYIAEGYCPTFLTAGNTDGFPDEMDAFAKRLEELGVEYEYYFIPREVCDLPHGYLNTLGKNQYARECFEHILGFMDHYTAKDSVTNHE